MGEWTEMKLTGDRCQCSACGEYFNSTYAFDKHRIGGWTMRRCRTSDAMEAVGMGRNAKGFWVSNKMSRFTWRQRQYSRELKEAL